MEQLVLHVKGSSTEPYELTFIKDGDSLTALCNCPAGTFGNLCKHRVSVLEGDTGSVIDTDKDKVNKVVAWLPGTDVESALAKLQAATGGPADALADAKRNLARTMNR